MTDKEMLDWLEEQAKKSKTGITFEYLPGRGFRFMRRHYLSEHCKDLRSAIKAAKYVSEGGPFSKD